jgi:hypothetical protein
MSPRALPRCLILTLTLTLTLAASLLPACDRSSPASQPPPLSSAPAPDPSDLDPTLTPLSAPLQTILPPGEGDPRAVEDLGPASPSLMFTAALKGYVEPCTCTLDVILGGIDRISGFARSFQALSPSLMLDAGNLLFEDTTLPPDDIPQAKLKARLLVQGLRAMGAQSTTPGPYDLALGLDAYKTLTESLPITALNLRDASGAPVGAPWRVLTHAGLRVGLVGVLDPAQFSALSDASVAPFQPPLADAMRALDAESVHLRVAVVQGPLDFARAVAQAAPSLDFIILGLEPRERDEPSPEANAFILEAYSQGRHLGVLKLYDAALTASPSPAPSGTPRFQNARLGSKSELDKLDRRIAYLDEAITSAPADASGHETPFVTKLRGDLKALRTQRLKLSGDAVQPPPSTPSFAYFSVPIAPGYPHDLAMYQRKQRYNDDLKALYTQELNLQPVAALPGQPAFLGQAACVSCHEDPHDVWQETKHSHAWATLEAKNKTFDPECVSCHVTGYAQPGGSIIGKTQGFENVQCEACHGPGSLHAADPDADDLIHREVHKETCIGCHDPANSPRFDYDKYIPLILGEGHGL